MAMDFLERGGGCGVGWRWWCTLPRKMKGSFSHVQDLVPIRLMISEQQQQKKKKQIIF